EAVEAGAPRLHRGVFRWRGASGAARTRPPGLASLRDAVDGGRHSAAEAHHADGPQETLDRARIHRPAQQYARRRIGEECRTGQQPVAMGFVELPFHARLAVSVEANSAPERPLAT